LPLTSEVERLFLRCSDAGLEAMLLWQALPLLNFIHLFQFVFFKVIVDSASWIIDFNRIVFVGFPSERLGVEQCFYLKASTLTYEISI
jgi:hypothetical protein